SADGWSGSVTATFDHSPQLTHTSVENAATRPRAEEEPALTPSGRWLLSDGISVQDSGDTWRFQVEHWPPGPLRAPMAELPLPPGWAASAESLITFEYRQVEPAAGEKSVSATVALRGRE